MTLEQGENAPSPADSAQSADAEGDSKRERSTIGFAYGDLDDAAAVARAIHNNAGTSCTLSQLAAFLDQPISSGTFRARVSNAAIFGVTENARREVSLTALGRRIADPAAEPAARVDAFLHVPLCLRIFEHHDGYTLPGAAPLEKFMRELGVSPKQTGRARQAFMRSARQAGFFAHGEDRLVRPSFPAGGPGTRPVDGGSGDGQNKGKLGGSGSGGDGTAPPRHPLIEGMFQSLPENGQTWTLDEAADWLHAAAYNLRFAYKLKGKITVEITIEKPSEAGS
jgi:hypothetical protein